ncbi:MAG: flagellar protein FlbD [Armatimonadota bacterium]|nr:MAG: flagellar protein FlbD [Armatimonadota bacterium]
MIKVTRLDHSELVVNAELIETIEATPDTVITLTSGKKLVVSEDVEEIVRRVLEYRRHAYRLHQA